MIYNLTPSDIVKLSSVIVTTLVACAGIVRFSGRQVITFTSMLKDISSIKDEIHEIKSNHLLHLHDDVASLRQIVTQHLLISRPEPDPFKDVVTEALIAKTTQP